MYAIQSTSHVRVGTCAFSDERIAQARPVRTRAPRPDLALKRVDDCVTNRKQVLDIRNLGLREWPGLPAHIDTLRAGGNRLRRAPECWPPALLHLDLSGNRFEHVPDSMPSDLISLDMSFNRLKTVRSLPQRLSTLTLSNNQLFEFDAPLPPYLDALDLTSNLLEKIPSHLPRYLRSLSMSNNLVARIPDDLPATLEKLRVDRNEGLKHLPAHWPPRIARFSACACDIESLDTRLPDSLEYAFFDDNRIDVLPALSASLRVLSVRDNFISTIPVGDAPGADTARPLKKRERTRFAYGVYAYVPPTPKVEIDLRGNPIASRGRSGLTSVRAQLDARERRAMYVIGEPANSSGLRARYRPEFWK
jgi:hypothetical protein